MTVELGQSIGTIVKEDPQEVNWRQKIGEWARNEISHEELLEHYPSYLLSVPERIARFLQRKVSQLRGKSGVK